MSSGKGVVRLPCGAVFEHGSQDAQQLSHVGGQCHLFGFTHLQESQVECLDGRIVPSGYQSTHVKRPTHFGPSAPYATFSPELSTVPVERGHAHQGSDFLAVERSQLWQTGQQDTRQDISDTWDALEQVVLFPPDWGGDNQLGQVLIQTFEALFQKSDVDLDFLPDPCADRGRAVVLSRDHLDDLASASCQIGQFSGLKGGQGTNLLHTGLTPPGFPVMIFAQRQVQPTQKLQNPKSRTLTPMLDEINRPSRRIDPMPLLTLPKTFF